MKHTFEHINNATGFANGERWAGADEVRKYFRREHLVEVGAFPEDLPAQHILNEMADTVILNHWHMERMAYTTGYRGHKIPDLVKLAEKEDAYVVDIRFMPFGRYFRQADLKKALMGLDEGIYYSRYAWVRELGNQAYKTRGPHQIVDMEKGVERISQLAAVKPLILLCACENANVCHRTTVGRALAMRGWNVLEVAM